MPTVYSRTACCTAEHTCIVDMHTRGYNSLDNSGCYITAVIFAMSHTLVHYTMLVCYCLLSAPLSGCLVTREEEEEDRYQWISLHYECVCSALLITAS